MEDPYSRGNRRPTLVRSNACDRACDSAGNLRRTPSNARGQDRNRRSRLCRIAACHGVRRDRFRGHRHRPRRGQGERSQGGSLLPRGRPGRALRQGRRPPQADDRLRGGRRARRADDLRPDPTVEDANAGPLLHRLGCRVGRRTPAPRTARRPPVDDVPGDDGGDRPADPRGGRPAGRPGLLPRLRTRARRPRQSGVHDQEHAQARRRCDAGMPAPNRAPVRGDRGHDRPLLLHPRRRDGEDPREHLPGGQHRAGERTRAHVRQARDLGVGGDRGRLHEAVRLPLPLSRPRPRRRLHPDRPALPRLAAARVRLLRTDDRGGARDQRAHADVRRAEGRGRAQRRRQADQGLEDPAARRRLQGERPRHARVAELRGHAPADPARGERLVLRSVGAGVRARRRAALERRVVGASRWRRRTASFCSPSTASFSSDRSGIVRG